MQAVTARDEPVGPRGQVVDPFHPLHPDRGRIEGHQVSEISGGDPAPAGYAEDGRRVPGDPQAG